MNVLTPQVFADWLGLGQLTRRESVDMNLMLTIAAHLIVTAGFFYLTSFFYKEEKDEYVKEREAFFVDIETPVIAENDQDDYDRQQRNKLGSMVLFMGMGMTFMALIPNPLWGRLVFITCALVILAVGLLLKKSANPNDKAIKAESITE
jgi:hypothetical protein